MGAPEPYRTITCRECGQPREVPNGEYLRWLRTEAGEGLNNLAAHLGKSGTYVSDLERNRKRPAPEVLALYETRFAEFLPDSRLETLREVARTMNALGT